MIARQFGDLLLLRCKHRVTNLRALRRWLYRRTQKRVVWFTDDLLLLVLTLLLSLLLDELSPLPGRLPLLVPLALVAPILLMLALLLPRLAASLRRVPQFWVAD